MHKAHDWLRLLKIDYKCKSDATHAKLKYLIYESIWNTSSDFHTIEFKVFQEKTVKSIANSKMPEINQQKMGGDKMPTATNCSQLQPTASNFLTK